VPLSFRPSPSTFTVEEIPLFPPGGKGEHLYLTVRRSGLSTPGLAAALARLLGLHEREVGIAGLKDEASTAVQTLSVPARVRPLVEKCCEEAGVELISAALHDHKLRTGHLAGNRFRSLLNADGPFDLSVLEQALDRLSTEGMSNGYGPQRFADPKAVERGRRLFSNGRKPRAKRDRFALSVFQAWIFNEVLAERTACGCLATPLRGDLLTRHGARSNFYLEDAGEDIFDDITSLRVSPTGPLPGRKVRLPRSDALDLEQEVLERCGLDSGALASCSVRGARRALRVPVAELLLEPVSASMVALAFTLPPGSYATELMRQIDIDVQSP